MASVIPATIEDVPALVNLVNSAYRGNASMKGWTTEAHLLDGIRTDDESVRALISKPDSTILKYLDDKNELVGCVYLEKKARQLYLGMLSVSPVLQTNGIGKQLIEASEHYAKEHEAPRIIMTVISVRTELIEWYKRRGYSLTGETRPFPNNIKFGIPKQPLEFVVMQKQLVT
jgi:N-acetylglutamate synthase-like GNAT family acetyltransferase